MIRAAFVANSSWYIYNLRLGVLKALRLRGVEIVIISPVDDSSLKLINEGFRLIPLKLKNSGKNPFMDLKLLLKFKKIYSEHKFDFIFHYTVKPNIYGTLAAGLCGLKSTAIISGRGHSFLNRGFLFSITKLLYRYSLPLAGDVWFVNLDDKDFFLRQNMLKASIQTRVLQGEGVNLSYFKPCLEEEKNLGINFLFSGRLIWSKGFREYVETARIIKQRHNNVKFQVLGFFDVANPTSLSEKEVLTLHSEGVIEYLGFTDDVRPFLSKTDCFVFPSYYGEGTPRSLLEAASMKIPIITTDHVGCKDVVEHGLNGYLCRPKSVDDLVLRIEQFLMLTEAERLTMGREGRKKMKEQFDEKFIIDAYLEKLSLHEKQIAIVLTENNCLI